MAVRGLNEFYRQISTNNTNSESFALIQKFLFSVQIIVPPTSRLRNVARFNDNILTLMARSIDVPNITTDNVDAIDTYNGVLSMTGSMRRLTSESEFEILFLNTVGAVHENFFYHWIRESLAFEWIYPDTPFTKATVIVDILQPSDAGNVENSIVSYKLYDVFPVSFDTISPSHAPEDLSERKVKFKFNYMTIKNAEYANHHDPNDIDFLTSRRFTPS